MKACFLAAGRGSRLGESDLPKPLWEIAPGITILGRQIAALRERGIDDICVVIGWKKELMRERLADAGVTFVENTHPDLAESGSAHSFQFAARSPFDPLDGKQPCLMLDADLVYERCILEPILTKNRGPSRILVSPRVKEDSEEVRVYGDNGRPRLLGKNLGPLQTRGLELLGEATGIVRFEPQDHPVVRSLVEAIRIGEEHEWIVQSLMKRDRIRAVHFPEGLLFMEADSPEDFERVRRDVYPAIVKREGA